MAEEKAPSYIRGWIKACITSIMGLCSGAVLMYVSPLVTNTIKPGKPLANFGQHVEGLTVTFQNRATGASDGWWDFGDGSPLEPFAPAQETISHTYPNTGNYDVKLSLRNFIGDESDRTVPVKLEGGSNTGAIIEAFKVEPLQPNATAPATFKVTSQIKNADICIWSLGDDRPLDVSTDTSVNQERYVTIREPGSYTVRLAAVGHDKLPVEKAASIIVATGSSTAPVANLQVTFQAVHVQREPKQINVPVFFPHDHKEQAYSFSVSHTEPGFQIVEAKFARPVKEAFVKNPNLAISRDKSKVLLTGELVKPGGILAWQKNAPPLLWIPSIELTLEQRKDPVMKTPDPIATELTLPGTTFLPVPKLSSRWEIKGTMFHLELLDGTTLVFKDSKLPVSYSVHFKNHPYHFTAVQESDRIRLELVDAQATLSPVGN